MLSMWVFGERSTMKSRSPLRIPDGEREVRLPGLRQPVHEREEVVRAEHVDGSAPQLGVSCGERQGHVAAVRAPHDTGPRRVHPFVVRKHLGHGVDVVEAVQPTPVAVDTLRVVEPVAGRSARVRDEHGEPLEREDLDERHREPREVRPFLALRPAVDVVDERPRTLVAELGRREVEPSRHA